MRESPIVPTYCSFILASIIPASKFHSRWHVTTLIVLLLFPFSVSVCSLTPILLCSIYFDGAEIKDTSSTTTTILRWDFKAQTESDKSNCRNDHELIS